MSAEFLMPKLGLTMEEGKIIEWLIGDGDRVDVGTTVLRIETDKVESDVESPHVGFLRQTARVGDIIPCGGVIGQVLDAPDQLSASTPRPSSSRPFISPNAYRVAATLGVDPLAVPGSGPSGRVVSEDVEEYARSAATSTPSPRRTTSPTHSASPAAQQLAELLGLDITEVTPEVGSDRISRDDVARHVRTLLARMREETRGPARTPAPERVTTAPTEQIPVPASGLTGMRGTIARRMVSSLRDMAQLTLTMEAPSDALLEHRRSYSKTDVVPGITDYVLAATARALRRHPMVNAQVGPAGIERLPDVHVGLAVALDEGLVVPVIHHADTLRLVELAAHSRRLADAARRGILTLEDLEGGTMSVTALGMYGVDAFTPIINPPNAAILGVGRIRPVATPSKKKGKKSGVDFHQSMTFSLTWDHRVFDGAPAAEFCSTVVEFLQNPDSLA